MLLEVESESELDLPVGAEPDGAFDGRTQKSEGRTGPRLRVFLARLETA